MGVFDMLIQDIIDYKTGVIYPALSCCNNDAMAARCKVINAPKVIWSVKSSEVFNSEISILLRNGFRQGKLNLLVSEFEADEILKNTIPNFTKMESFEQMLYKMPYVQTTLLVYELIKLNAMMNKGNTVKIKEQSGKRKDRFSSLAYNYWVQCELERELLRPSQNELGLVEYARKLKHLNKKPNIY